MKSIPFWDGTPEGFDAYIEATERMSENLRELNEIMKRANLAIKDLEGKIGSDDRGN